MKILITGARGMIGSNIVSLLGDDPNTRRGLVCADLRWGEDLRKFDTCLRATKGVDRVFHLADHTVGIGYSNEHHGEMLTESLRISLNVLEAARENGVKEYLYVSSSCVYPDVGTGHVPTKEFDGFYGTPEEANLGYGLAKRIGEAQALFYAKEYRMRIVIARPANIYGPSYNWGNQHKHVIPSLITQMLSGQEEIVVWGSGKQTRTFMHERDAARMIVELMDKGKSGEAYNLGGRELSIEILTDTLATLCQYKGKVTFDIAKPEGPRRKAYYTEKINMLGIVEKLPMLDGLTETVEAARKVFANVQA